MQSVDDLNFKADRDAGLYDEVCLMTVESLDLADVAGGGDPVALTYGVAGEEGPTAECPAIDGIAWSVVTPFTLSEAAPFMGLLRGGVLHDSRPLPNAVGPGPVPFVHGIGPSADDGTSD